MLLFFLLLGGRPSGRHTEQHDVFFSIGNSVGDLISDIEEFWPESKSNIHIDAWRPVTKIDNFSITVVERNNDKPKSNQKLLPAQRKPGFMLKPVFRAPTHISMISLAWTLTIFMK